MFITGIALNDRDVPLGSGGKVVMVFIVLCIIEVYCGCRVVIGRDLLFFDERVIAFFIPGDGGSGNRSFDFRG